MANKEEAVKKVEEEADLVAVEKDGKTLHVHPTCVDDHKFMGWKEVAE